MKLESFFGLFIFFTSSFIINCAWGETLSIRLQYQPLRKIPSLQKKLGSTLGIAPFQDQRGDKQHIGHTISPRKGTNYFKSDPFPLESAIVKFLSQLFSHYEVKTVLVSNWDGKLEAIKNIEADSIMRVKIKRFWAEGRTPSFRTSRRTVSFETIVNTSIYLIIDLGVKKKNKVFTRDIYIGKEMTVAILTAEKIEETINQIMSEIFGDFFSNFL